MDTTLLKGLSVLELLAASDHPNGITELAEKLGWMKSNVHRVLQTLSHAGYVTKDPDSGRYQCTLKLWELGTLVTERLDIRAVARSYVLDLAGQTGESVHLSVLDGSEVLYIDKIDSDQPVRSYTRIGGRAPAYCVATGKALLAYSGDAALADVRKHLKPYTPRTIADWEQLQKELQRIRDSGYATNRGEWRESVHGLAAPVLDGHKRAIAAIGVSGPSDRLSLKRMREFAPLVMSAASAISRNLGFTAIGPAK